MVLDPPEEYKEIRYGWYQIDDEWWITKGAVAEALETTTKKAEEFFLKNKDNINTTTEVNKYNGRTFTLYSYDDLVYLWQDRDDVQSITT